MAMPMEQPEEDFNLPQVPKVKVKLKLNEVHNLFTRNKLKEKKQRLTQVDSIKLGISIQANQELFSCLQGRRSSHQAMTMQRKRTIKILKERHFLICEKIYLILTLENLFLG